MLPHKQRLLSNADEPVQGARDIELGLIEQKIDNSPARLPMRFKVKKVITLLSRIEPEPSPVRSTTIISITLLAIFAAIGVLRIFRNDPKISRYVEEIDQYRGYNSTTNSSCNDAYSLAKFYIDEDSVDVCRALDEVPTSPLFADHCVDILSSLCDTYLDLADSTNTALYGVQIGTLVLAICALACCCRAMCHKDDPKYILNLNYFTTETKNLIQEAAGAMGVDLNNDPKIANVINELKRKLELFEKPYHQRLSIFRGDVIGHVKNPKNPPSLYSDFFKSYLSDKQDNLLNMVFEYAGIADRPTCTRNQP